MSTIRFNFYWLFSILIIASILNSRAVFAEDIRSGANENGKIWVSTGFLSYHTNRRAHYNERNSGIAVEYGLNEDSAIAVGHYKNSVWRESTYIHYVYTPIKIWNTRLGGAVGVIDGYPLLRDGKFAPVLLPVASTTFRLHGVNFGFNTVYIPSVVPKVDGAIAIQFKIALN